MSEHRGQDRRAQSRRRNDRDDVETIGTLKKAIEVLSNATKDLRRLAWTAVAILAVVSVAAVIALLLALIHSEHVNQQSQAAITKADRALSKAHKNSGILARQEDLLQAESAGSCFRVNYLRWQDDKERYATWKRDRHAAAFLNKIPNPATDNLATFFNLAAQQTYFLPLTDCQRADSHPTTYRPPLAIPFTRVSKRELDRVLNHPPKPPRT